MQTFMPYPSMRESVDVLDQARLGKQRVETLQLLRSALLPSYGWQSHPVSVMWRGYLPGLVAYGLRSVDAWTERGHADTTRPLILEFAPEVDGLSQAELTDRGLLPDWIGDEAVHRSHRSNLIAKAPEFYRPLFPGTPEDLDYHWPSGGEAPAASGRPRLQVVRAADAAELHAWTEAGIVRIGAMSPRGSAGPAWQAQLTEFVDAAAVGDRIGVVEGAGAAIRLAAVLGEAVAVSGPGMIADASGGDALIRRVRFEDALERSALPVPAQLQNPRHCFTVELPAS